MKYRELEYSRTFNLGEYESERVALRADLDETDDIDETFKTMKGRIFKLHEEGQLLEETRAAVEADRRLESIRQAFPKELQELLIFEEKSDSIIAKPKAFLGSDNFAKIASIVRNLKGEYISAGKDSHFKIPKNP